MAKGDRVVSQSKTMWVKKGTIVDGKEVKKGYLAQYGKPEKKVNARVQMVEQTMGVAKGDTQKYVQGRRVTEKFGQPNKEKTSSTARRRTAISQAASAKKTTAKAPARATKDLTAAERNRTRGTQGGATRMGLSAEQRNRLRGTVSEMARSPLSEQRLGTSGSARVGTQNMTAAQRAAVVAGARRGATPQKAGGPKKGDKKTTMAGVAYYDGTKWVPASRWKGKK